MSQKIGRNDPCPCGSGKKYKNCCFKKNFIEIQAARKEVEFTMPGQEDFTSNSNH